MSSTHSSPPRSFRLKIAGKTYVATYDVQDGCVQVTHKGRRSTWTEIRDARAVDVARMLLKELLAMLLAVVYINAPAGPVDATRGMHPQTCVAQPAPHVWPLSA